MAKDTALSCGGRSVTLPGSLCESANRKEMSTLLWLPPSLLYVQSGPLAYETASGVLIQDGTSLGYLLPENTLTDETEGVSPMWFQTQSS